MRRKLWVVTIVVGIALIPIGVGWILYSVFQTGHYDPNVQVQISSAGGGFTTTTRGAQVSDSAWPIIGFVMTFAGGIMITVGTFGLAFGWLSGDDDDDDRPSTQSILANAVPTTRVGWGSETTPGSAPGTPPRGG